MNVIDRYLSYKLHVSRLELDLRWLEKQGEIIRSSAISEIQGSGSSTDSRLDEIISRKQRIKIEIEEYSQLVDHVNVVLDVLKEKYNEKKDYERFDLKYLQGKSFRYIARETHCSHEYARKIADEILKDFEELTGILR